MVMSQITRELPGVVARYGRTGLRSLLGLDEIGAWREQVGQTQKGEKHQQQERMVEENIAQPGCYRSPCVAGKRTFSWGQIIAVAAKPQNLPRSYQLRIGHGRVRGERAKPHHHMLPRCEKRVAVFSLQLLALSHKPGCKPGVDVSAAGDAGKVIELG